MSRACTLTHGNGSETPVLGLTALGLSPDACRMTQQAEDFSCFLSVSYPLASVSMFWKIADTPREPRKGSCDIPCARRRALCASILSRTPGVGGRRRLPASYQVS